MKSKIIELENYDRKKEVKILDKIFIENFDKNYEIDNDIFRCIQWKNCKYQHNPNDNCFGICLPGNSKSSIQKFEEEINKNYNIGKSSLKHLKEREQAIDKSNTVIICRGSKTKIYDETTIHDYFYAKSKDKIIIFRDDFK